MKINKITIFVRLILLFCLTQVITGCTNDSEDTDKTNNGQISAFDSQAGQIKIVILGQGDFFPDRAVQQRMGLPDNLAARIIEHLAASNRFIVLERTALRKIINEQQFGQEKAESFLDRTLNAAIDNLPEVSGYSVAATGILSDHNDLIKEYQNLGTALGADYLVFATLEKVHNKIENTAIPYSASKKQITKNTTDARLRLRIINTATGRIAGADSFRTKVSETVFAGIEPERDALSIFDDLGVQAADKILNITFPAQILNDNPLVINRGSNDGYQEGEIFEIVRPCKAITNQAGSVIGQIKSSVGNIKLSSVQETIAVVELVSGEAITGDLLKNNAAKSAQNSATKTPKKVTTQSGKTTLAVGNVKFNVNKRNKWYLVDDSARIKTDLMVKLNNTNRFEVLERKEIDQVLDEKTFTAITSGTDIDAEMQELIGADYLVILSIDDFIINTKRQEIAYVDEIHERYYGIVEATIRIIDSHTGKLIGADKIRVNKKLTKYSKNHTKNVYGDLIDDLTSLLVSNILTRIYPIKVMAVMADGSVYINRGQDGGLQVGATLNVMRQGESLIDPDTGIAFGSAETQVAQLRINNVETSRSKATIISGKAVTRGDLLRPVKKAGGTQKPTVKVRRPNF